MKVDIHFVILPTNCTPKYIPKRNENIRPQNDSHANVHNDFIIIVPGGGGVMKKPNYSTLVSG